MASNLFYKKDCAVRFRLRSAAADGRAAAGSAAAFYITCYFLDDIVSGSVALGCRRICMIVKDVMTRNPVYVSPETTLTEAKALMTKKNINKLPVIDKNDRLAGIITKNDLAKAGPSDATTLDMYEIGYLLSKLTVEKIMTKKVVTVSENEIVEEAARIMVDNQIGCLPVMKDDILIGIVTESDLFHLFTNMFGARHEGVRVTISSADKPGQLAKIAEKIAALNGNIVSVVTDELKEPGVRRLTIKATDITLERMQSILSDCGVSVEDIRVV